MIVDARLAKKALSGRANKSDVNDAEGLAWLALTGWYRRAVAKSETARIRRSLLVARAQLCGQRRAAEGKRPLCPTLKGVGGGAVHSGRFQRRKSAPGSARPCKKIEHHCSSGWA